MPSPVVFGTVSVELLGFDPYNPTPTVRGSVDGQVTFTIGFDRAHAMEAFNVYYTFLAMARQANEAADRAQDVQAIGQAILSIEGWFLSFQNTLRQEGAPQNEQQAVQGVLMQLSTLKQELSS